MGGAQAKYDRTAPWTIIRKQIQRLLGELEAARHLASSCREHRLKRTNFTGKFGVKRSIRLRSHQGVLRPFLCHFKAELRTHKISPSTHKTQARVSEYGLFRQRIQPAGQRNTLSLAKHVPGCRSDQAGGFTHICTGQRMPHRLIHHPLLQVPATRPAVQFGYQRWVIFIQAHAQYLCKEMMVAVPDTFLIDGEDKQVC